MEVLKYEKQQLDKQVSLNFDIYNLLDTTFVHSQYSSVYSEQMR